MNFALCQPCLCLISIMCLVSEPALSLPDIHHVFSPEPALSLPDIHHEFSPEPALSLPDIHHVFSPEPALTLPDIHHKFSSKSALSGPLVNLNEAHSLSPQQENNIQNYSSIPAIIITELKLTGAGFCKSLRWISARYPADRPLSSSSDITPVLSGFFSECTVRHLGGLNDKLIEILFF